MNLPKNMRNGELERVFFISGSGRSGTQWLSALMRESPSTFIQHEWWRYRYGALVPQHRKAVGLPQGAGRIDYARQRLMDTKAAMDHAIRAGHTVYGECGNKTRYVLRELKDVFQADFTIQLIRDGRDVVRSFWPRQTYTGHDLHPPIEPGPSDPYYARWGHMDRFEKLCWLWQFTVMLVDRVANGTVCFEDLLADYGELHAKILEPAGMTIPVQVWEAYVGCRIDKSHFPLRMAHWADWDDQRTSLYWNICGDAMRHFGYA